MLLELLSLAALLVAFAPLDTDLAACCSLASKDLLSSGVDGRMDGRDSRSLRNVIHLHVL